MKKSYIIFFLFLQTSLIFGQTIISTKITADHKEIRGSKIHMIVPENFKLAKNFLGFQQAETNSSIMVLDIPGSFAKVSTGLNAENLLKQGFRVESIESIVLNSVSGLLIKGAQTAYGIEFTKFSLAFGTENESILINGIAPKDNIDLEQSVKNALLSTVYDPTKKLTPLDAVDFEITTEGTDFVFAKSMSNMLIYNRDGKMPSESLDKSSLVLAKAFSKVEITHKKEYAINRIKTLPVQITKIIEILPLEINGLQGFEITAEGVNRKTGIKEQVYQVMLFTATSYYILYGSSTANFDENLKVFQKLIGTFKLK